MICIKTIIVGGVAGGASAGARLRRLDENAEIIILERGDYISYANCGLPYYIGGEITNKASLTIQTPQSFKDRFNIDVRVKNEVIKIDTTKKTVEVKNHFNNEVYEESYDNLILSPGAKPILPNISGIDNDRVFTLRSIPDTYLIKEFIDKNNPKKAVVVGGGYIGCELAENLHNAGLKVTIIEMANHVIAPIDYDVACTVHRFLSQKGISLMLNTTVKKIENNENYLEVFYEKGKISTDMVIMSAGVVPDTLFAKNSGIKTNERGAIIVDENLKTNADSVYAVGDAIEVENFITKDKSFIPLAGPANKQGRIVADNICAVLSKYRGTQGTSILKLFEMTVASTGLNETVAKKVGICYDKIFLLSPSHATYYPGASNMLIKVLFENKTGKILGAQIAGYDGVDKRIDVIATAIRANFTAFDLTQLELAYAPPYSAAKDPVNMAGYVIENILTDKVKQFHWHDVENIINNDNITFLDVRTISERKRGYIDSTIHIPLDELRNNIHKLDIEKPIYVHCHSGLRSYIACRILAQKGFNCYNLAGGYQLYELIVKV